MKHFWFTQLLAICTLTAPVISAEGLYGPYRAEYLGTIDGDTIDVVLHIYPGLEVTTRIRERTIDTPELRRSPKCEKTLAMEASAYTQKLMDGATRITVEELDYGTFQPRMVGIIYVDAIPLGTLLKKRGYAVDYAKRDKHKWC